MIDNLLTVAQQVAILFVLIGVGAFSRQCKWLDEKAVEGLVNLLILIVTPCLIVDCFQRPFAPSMLKGLGIAFALTAVAHLLAIVLARTFVRHPDEATRRPLLLSVVFSNVGFMGIPLEQALLGSEGVFYGVVYVAVFNLFMWSWGLVTMMDDAWRVKNLGFGRVFLRMTVNPGTVGLAVALPLFFFSVRLPDVIAAPIHHLANLNTPVAMVVIGYSLLGARLDKVGRLPGVYVATVLRLVICPLAMIAVMVPFRRALDPAMMMAVAIGAATPVAAMVSMFATRFNRDVDAAVAMVSGTTVLSIVTMPVVVALAMAVLK